MKKINIILFVAILFITSCNEKIESNKETDFSKELIDVRSQRIKGEIPYESNAKLKSLLKDTENHTWQELDTYYRNVILKTMTHEDYFMNLQNVVFKRLVNSYNFLEEASIETKEFYLQEQSKVEYNAFPVFLAQTLNSIKDDWTQEQIQAYVDKNLTKTIEYINKTFDDPQDLINRSQYDHNYLRSFAETLNLPEE